MRSSSCSKVLNVGLFVNSYSKICIKKLHIPVMKTEVIEFLSPKKGQVFVDMTFGAGGHTREVLNSAEDVKVFALDRDPHAHQLAIEMAKEFQGRLVPLLGRFSELPSLLSEHNLAPSSVDGFLLDAGCSSMQLNEGNRGFSYNTNGPLDMRMDANRFPKQPNAADVLNSLDGVQLAKMFKMYGEEKKAKRIAQAIIEARYLMKDLKTTSELAQLVTAVVGSEPRYDKLQRISHPATKIFQALRIFVNNELNELNYGMEIAFRYLRLGGRLAALSFHSLEDRIVKRHLMGIDLNEAINQNKSQQFRNAAKSHSLSEIEEIMPKKWHQIHKHVILPSQNEIDANSRSRSAKFRAAEKIMD